MRQGIKPEHACRQVVERIVKRDPAKARKLQVGFLAVNKKGQYGAFAIHKGFTYAVKNAKSEMVLEAKSYFK